MDFYDILKEAARNKQKAQKELEGNKRYSLNFKPMKKISRPKVNKAAINAQLKKKEEDQRKKAEQEEKEKQRVLALRAEQEAAKTAKRRRDSSSRGSSSTKSEKVPGKKKVVHQDEEREERQERKKVSPSFPKEEKHKDFRLSNNHKKEEGRVKSKSVSSKLLPDAKAKPSSAPSFKELMNIAASNAGTSTSGSNTLINGEKEKCSPNVKLKAKADSHRENLKAKSEKSFKREPLPVKNERSSHKHQNSIREPVQQGKSHTGMKVKKKTFFTNTKDASKSESRGPKSRESSPESRGPKSRELSQESRGPKSRESSPKSSSGKLPNSSAKQSNLKRAPDNSGEKQRGERKGKVNREEIGKSVQQPVKRKGGWLDPPVTEPKRKPEDSAVRKNGAIKHVIKPNEKKSSTAGEMERSKEKKRGWLDPVPRNPPVGNVVQSESRGKKLAVPTNASMSKVNKTTPPAAVKAKKQGRLDSERIPTGSVPPPAKGKKGGRLDAAKTNSSSGRREKGGWLDPPSAPRERNGGWLGSMQEPTETRPGGWLGGAVREPSLAARRGRLLSSEDEEEDSDMDDFIDDTPFEGPGGGGNVSSYIKEIFGYDSSKYKYESDYALKSMEASYSQILKEEARSARIAREEDAEEWRKEKELEKKKLAAKAKRK